MKNTIICSLLGASLIVTTGCVNWRDGSEGIKPYVKPAVALTVLTVLDNAVDEEDRMKRALVIYHAGGVIEALASGNVPTADILAPALEGYLPEGLIWVDFIESLNDIYKTAYSRTNGDTQLALSILVEVAAGCRQGAGRYLQENPSGIPEVIEP
jgi:hypothetical protein